MLEKLSAGALALALVAVPGSIGPATAEPAPVYRVEAGTVLQHRMPTWVLPVRGYRLTGRFGETSQHWRSAHTGLDFAAAWGTPIRSLGAGIVTSAEYDDRYGNKTVITLRDGSEVWYCHQEGIGVVLGQWVRPGQRIGRVGSTGNVTGPHLHLEIRPGKNEPADPLTWLRKRGLRP